MPAPTGAVFSTEAARTVSKVAKRVTQTPRRNRSARLDRSRQGVRETWAKVTSSSLISGAYRHAWTEQRVTAIGWEDMPSGMSGTTSINFALADDETQQIPANKVCRIYWNTDSANERQFKLQTGGVATKIETVVKDLVCNGDGTISITYIDITVIDDGS